MVDKQKIAETIHTVCEKGLELLEKEDFGPTEHGKLKVIRNLGSFVNSGVLMLQQEVSIERIKVIRERMSQLGYKKQGVIEK